MGNFLREAPSVQVRHTEAPSDGPPAEAGDEVIGPHRNENPMRTSNRSFHNLRHPQQDLFLALNQAAGYGHLVGSTERSVRAVMALGQQMVADRTRPVPPVARVADTDVVGGDPVDDLDLAA